MTEDGTVAESVTFAWEDTRLAEQSTPEGNHTTWDYTPDAHRPLTQTDHTSLVREPGESLIEKFTGGDDDTTPRFHAIITDLVGTPTELVTAAGDLSWQHRTTLWGTDFPSGASRSTVDCPLRFPGQYADPETGLYYNYFRHYDPETARYVTPDPLGLEPAPNHHAYVRNPHADFDPLGLKGKNCKPSVSPVASDWATKGAHVHVGQDEVRVFIDKDGKVAGEPIRLKSTGWASDKSVKTAVDAVNNDTKLRADLLAKAKSAKEHMDDHNWGNKQNRSGEMQKIIEFLED
ncbi:RHS repeat-associated core domain-containing protein [Streptomyces antimycoticus]|uniref:RHS repeat-associated core domain-containing protein n=1 Tax=Streptomyces antimycoticus TaxID=68175 RepID=UPI003F4E1A6C